MKNYVEVEVIENGQVVNDKRTTILEHNIKIDGYQDFIQKISKIETDLQASGFGDARMYDYELGRSIWKSGISTTFPILPRDEQERILLNRIYVFMYGLAEIGEYPLKQKLCTYLGVGIDDFYEIIKTPSHPNSNAYKWANDVMDMLANDNAIKSNGNNQARVWIDKSVEGKMAAETRVELASQLTMIESATKAGEELFKELMSNDEND